MRKPKPQNEERRTKCPISRAAFHGDKLKARVTVEIGDRKGEYTLDPQDFSTNSFGWHLNAKLEQVKIAGESCKVQLGCNLTVIGSKDVPK